MDGESIMKYAQIIKGKVHGIFEYDPLPEFAPNIVMVLVDGVTPEPKAGWMYDGTGFTAPDPVVEPVELGVLTVIKWAIAADSTDETVLTYTSDDAVQFVVDSVLYEVEPVGQVATLAISADAAGTINIYVQGQQVVIAAYEVTP